MALVLTTAVRSLVHRFRDAERGGCGTGRVTDDQACHVACAQYYHILQLPERQHHSVDVPDPPDAWKLADCDKEDTLTQVGEKLQAVISLQGHGPDAVAFVLKYYDSTLTSKWRASVGSHGMPKTARGTDVAVHKTSRYPRMNVISGMAGTPSCGAWVCKCVGGLVEETEIRKHFDSAAKMKLHDGRLEAKMNSERRAAAVVRAAGVQVPAALKKRVDRCEVLSVTETMASSASSSASSGTLNTVEEKFKASLERSRARTVQQRRDTQVSDASGGEEAAAAEFKVPEPKTRGQKRKSEDAQEHHDQWWLRGVTETDDEPQETHTGDSPRAMSTRSSLAVFDADSLVEADKRANVNSLPRVRRAMYGGRYHVFTQALQDAQLYNAGIGVTRRGSVERDRIHK